MTPVCSMHSRADSARTAILYWERSDMMSLTERKANQILGIFFTVFALLLLFVIIPAQIKHIPNASPSPRFFPQIIAILLLVLGVFLLVSGLRRSTKAADEVVFSLSLKEAKLVGLTLGVFVLYTVALYFIPYIPATIAAMGILVTAYGQKSKRKIIISSVLLPLIIYFSFTNLLMLRLP